MSEITIPDAAIEAAAEAIKTASSERFWSWKLSAQQALTASYPHMEAAIRAAVLAEVEQAIPVSVIDSPDGSRRFIWWDAAKSYATLAELLDEFSAYEAEMALDAHGSEAQ